MASIGLSQIALGAYYYTSAGQKIGYNQSNTVHSNYYSLNGAKIQQQANSPTNSTGTSDTYQAPGNSTNVNTNPPASNYVIAGTQKIYYNQPSRGSSNYYPVKSASPTGTDSSFNHLQPAKQPQEKPQEQPQDNGTYQLTASELKLIELINQERTKAGLNPLIIDYQLARVARIKAEDMNANNYFSHDSPAYGSPFKMMKNFGISYKAAAENIGKTSSMERAHSGFMNSQEHRENIMNPYYTHIGVGISGNYYVEMFIRK